MSLRFVPADALGWLLLDTDPSSARWRGVDAAVEDGMSDTALEAYWEQLIGTGEAIDLDADVAPWVGRAAGVALLGVEDDADLQLAFAEVDSRTKLEDALEDRGWEPAKDGLGEGELNEQLELWSAPDDATGRYPAIAVADDSLIAATTARGIQEILERAEEYPAPERKATSDYTVEAMKRVPAAIVFRGDTLREIPRRLVADDPALLEMTGWINGIATVNALRDGWIGIAGPIKRGADSIRVVGAADWLGELATNVKPKPVPRSVLDAHPVGAKIELLDSDKELGSGVVAIHDPGQYIADAVNGITSRGSSFATKSDDMSKDRVELFEVLDELDGDGTVALTADGASVRVKVDDPDKVGADVERALETAGIAGTVTTVGDLLTVSIPFVSTGDTTVVTPRGRLDQLPGYDAAFDGAGPPPRPPIAWSYGMDPKCGIKPVAGWITWDGTARMTWSVHVPREALVCGLARVNAVSLLEG